MKNDDLFSHAITLHVSMKLYGLIVFAAAGLGHAVWWFYRHRKELSLFLIVREIVSLGLALGGVFWFLYGGFGIMDRVLYPNTNIYRHSPEETRLIWISIGGSVMAFILAGAWGFCTRPRGDKDKA